MSVNTHMRATKRPVIPDEDCVCLCYHEGYNCDHHILMNQSITRNRSAIIGGKIGLQSLSLYKMTALSNSVIGRSSTHSCFVAGHESPSIPKIILAAPATDILGITRSLNVCLRPFACPVS